MESICKNCIHCISTEQRHNGNQNELRVYYYCKLINADDYEIENMSDCDGFKAKPKNRDELKSRRQTAMKSGKEPRKKKVQILRNVDLIKEGIIPKKI